MIRRTHKRNEKRRTLNRTRRSRIARTETRAPRHGNIRRRKFESFESQSSFERAMNELKQEAVRLRDEYGEEVTDEMNVVFWAKNEDGTPCLVEGSYNYWSGDAELTMSEIADGAFPDEFVRRLDKYIEKEPEFVAEYLAEHIADEVINDLNIDADSRELQDIMWKRGDGSVDFGALVDYIRKNFDVSEEELDYDSYDRYAADHEESFVSYGWEYSTVNQGNLFYGRNNHQDGPTFGEVIYVGGFSQDIREWDGADDEEDINIEGLEKLADEIAKGTTERPRW